MSVIQQISAARAALRRLPVTIALPAALAIGAACKKPEAAPPPPPVVEVMAVATGPVPLGTTLIGQLDSPQNVEIRARVEGFVQQMHFIEGSEVAGGDLLFELDKQPFIERLAAAKGALEEAEAELKKFQNDVVRLTPLAQARAIPQQELDNALASVEVGEANLVTAKARLESAQIDLGYCEIRAPVSGLIGAKEVSIGELVGKGQPTLMATISTLDPIWFYCSVSEVEYLRAQAKSKLTGKALDEVPLTLILADGSEHPAPGKFVFVDRAVDPRTGTLKVRAEFPNSEKLLRPGMFARVRADLGKRPDTITVPERALVELQGKTFLWVVGDDGKVNMRPVATGEQVGPSIIINEGLKPGEKIVTEGIHKVREGMPVTVASATPAGPAQPANE